MKNRIFLAFYKGHGGNLLDKLTDFVVRVFTHGDYSHCEIAISKGGAFECYTSSPRDGGVRCKTMYLPSDKWDLMPVQNITEEQIKAYFNRTLGAKYDWWGALGMVLGIKQKRSKYFCSEWCFNAIYGNENGWRFSPNQLAVMFSSQPMQ